MTKLYAEILYISTFHFSSQFFIKKYNAFFLFKQSLILCYTVNYSELRENLPIRIIFSEIHSTW